MRTCAQAGSIRAMPETEIPRATRVDIYYLYGFNGSKFRLFNLGAFGKYSDKRHQPEHYAQSRAREQVGGVMNPRGKAHVPEQRARKQHRGARPYALRQQHRADDKRRSDVAAGKRMAAFFLLNDGKYSARLVGAFAVDQVAQERHREQA